MGLNTGLVPARVEAPVKQGLLELIDHAVGQGFSARWACRTLGIDHARVLSWRARLASGGALDDAAPGPLPGERVGLLALRQRLTGLELFCLRRSLRFLFN